MMRYGFTVQLAWSDVAHCFFLVPLQAYDCLGQDAVTEACRVIERMLQCTSPELQRRMVDGKACVGIIGRHQVTTDMPSHTYLKLQKGENT